MPDLHDSLSAIYDSINTSDYKIVLKQEWNVIKSESIDYGILEKAKNVCVIPGKFKWIDVGSWKSLFELMKKDDNNYFDGNVITIDTQDSLIISPDKLTAVIGMKDVAIINVNDATLVMPISRSEEVKDIVNLLNKKERISMKTKDIIKEFEMLAEQVGIKVIKDTGSFKGGFCILNDEEVIVINKNRPLEQHIRQLSESFSKMETNQIFIKPILRDLITNKIS